MRWNLSIRTKLLLVMTGLLVVSTGLSFLLHLREGRRIRGELESVVQEVVERLIDETRPGGFLSPSGRLAWEMERLIADYDFGPQWSVRLQRRPDSSWFEDGPLAFSMRDDVIPPASLETVLVEDLRDPIEAARKESLPRELLIAGSVLLVGLGLCGLIAARLTGPVKDLTRRMELVAGGDLPAQRGERPDPGAASAHDPTRDEIRQMSLAFSTMVERLREKRELEKKMFQAERLSAMGNLAAGVAHDIRNPLNTIGLNLEHLGDRFAPADPVERRRFLSHMDDIKGELRRLNELVRSFLSLARPDRGEKVACDLRDLTRDTLRLFRKEAESRGVRVTMDLEDVGPLGIDPQQIRGALTNLVLNGLGAMHDDEAGGELRVELFRRPRAEHPAGGDAKDRGGDEVVLRIADTGPGIEPEHLEKVFLPYFTTREDGTGLGLPIARRAVEANGGRIDLRSRPGEGTKVDVVLPVGAGGDDPDPDPGGSRTELSGALEGRGLATASGKGGAA